MNARLFIGAGIVSALLARPALADDQSVLPRETTGKIERVDQKSLTFTVSTATEPKTFHLTPDTKIITKDKPTATFSDLKTGDKVTVSFREERSSLVAERIEVASASPPPSATY